MLLDTLTTGIITILCMILLTWVILHVVYDCPYFLSSPPLSRQWCQLRCLLSGTYEMNHPKNDSNNSSKKTSYFMPSRVRSHLIIKWCLGNVFAPLFDVCMLIDDICYSDYKKMDLSKSIFLVGAFRTGSTSLHRQLFMDDKRYVSPNYFELFFPFVCAYHLCDKLRQIFGEERMNGIYANLLNFYFSKILGPEVTLRHPMTGYEAEEDDLLLGSWQKVGWYSITGFPHPRFWKNSGLIHKYSANDKNKVHEFYERTMKKIMYYRSLSPDYKEAFASQNPPVLLSKSHLIGLMPFMKKKYPECKVVGLVRHPKDAFTSWYALAQAALDAIANTGHIAPIPTAAEAHLTFWDHFTESEINFFDQYIGIKNEQNDDNCQGRVSADKTVALLTSKEYFSDHITTIEKLYNNWGLGSLDGTEYKRKLDEETRNHKTYKKEKKYKDPTLEDLGLSEEYMSKRYSDYISLFQLNSK